MEYPTCENCGGLVPKDAAECLRCGQKNIIQNAPDPKDGLPVGRVGDWALDKHERLRKYIDISRAARAKFARAGSTYIDPFCNYGRARIRETDTVVDGSPLVAYKIARDGGAPFSQIHLGDADPACVEVASQRLISIGGQPSTYVGLAEDTVREIAGNINPHGLHFAFLDPYNLEALPFSVVETLARVDRMDILIHFSLVDLQRNLERFIASEKPCRLDRFAPGWRNAIDPAQPQRVIRQQVLDHYLSLIRQLDMKPAQGVELVKGTRNQSLYWLVFAARHPLAVSFWEKIRHVGGQRQLL